MAANPTTEQRATDQHARNITTYDLIIGILAIFSLILLIPIYFGNVSSQDKTVLIYVEDALCVVSFSTSFGAFVWHQTSGDTFSRVVVGLTCWVVFHFPHLPYSALPACSALSDYCGK